MRSRLSDRHHRVKTRPIFVPSDGEQVSQTSFLFSPPLPCSWHVKPVAWKAEQLALSANGCEDDDGGAGARGEDAAAEAVEMSGINRRAWVSRLSLTRPGGCRVEESRRTGPLGGSFWFRLGLCRSRKSHRSAGRRHGCTGGPESGRIRPDLLQNGNVSCVWSRLLHRVHPLPEVWARWEKTQQHTS